MAIESLSYLSPESTLLLLCSSTELNSRDFDSIRVMVEKGVDWDLLLQHALYHKSFPLFYNALKGVCPDMVPEAVLQQLKGHYMKNAVHSLFLAGTFLSKFFNFLSKMIFLQFHLRDRFFPKPSLAKLHCVVMVTWI